jgi:hypothetical protein
VKPALPSPAEIAAAPTTTLEALERDAQVMPSWKDVAAIAGTDECLKPDASGEITVNLDLDPSTEAGRKRRGAYMEMMSAHVEREKERCSRYNGTADRVVMKNPATGERVAVDRSRAVQAESKGLRVVEGRKATHRWINGVWYRRDGKRWVLDSPREAPTN